MSQNRSDRFQITTSAVVLMSVLALAGCNPAPDSEKATTAHTAVPAASSVQPAPAAAVEAPVATTPAPPAVVTPTSATVGKPATQTAPATPARTAPAAAATTAARPAVVTAGLPAGAGREVVQRVCGSCHGIDTVTAVGRTPQQWAEIIGQMQNMGLSASDEDLATVHAYLSKQLPPK